ncbi:hypothetical protein O9G_004582 [Rozella allomycis CSF55]|uniref:BSD domain-containing protein n=1 Tax=Rozella allomycis (strain CSF55) TaxID=988480 RepID=A0A075B2G8_ROZAC|nr:hypothetical protein O9G_004582 [Rozella allomycis CSF55]|eukprot:EPZ36790.1 hypothetical protein O9G_004582 [Rozella allomycis CSF55]
MQFLTELTGEIKNQIKSTISNLTEEFQKEKNEFMAKKAEIDQNETEEFWDKYTEDVKKRILELSNDSRNFLVNPPVDTEYQSDYATDLQKGIGVKAIMKVDEKLQSMRYQLVPTNFWRNYFYRVHMIVMESEDNVLFDNSSPKKEEPIVVMKSEDNNKIESSDWDKNLDNELEKLGLNLDDVEIEGSEDVELNLDDIDNELNKLTNK